MRKMMRDRFDRIEIIDLRGDIRLGPRAGVARDVGVFDIQVGTAITIAIADGSRAGEEAEVYYLDAWADARFARSAKQFGVPVCRIFGRRDSPVPIGLA